MSHEPGCWLADDSVCESYMHDEDATGEFCCVCGAWCCCEPIRAARADATEKAHRIVRIWQERPTTMEWNEVSYRCSCGMVYKHQPMPIGEGHDVEYVCAAARGDGSHE